MPFSTSSQSRNSKNTLFLPLLMTFFCSHLIFAEDVPDDVQAIFATNCVNGCHVTGIENGGLNLSDKTTSFIELFEISASCDANQKRVRERNASASVLYSKIVGSPICGNVMPPSGNLIDAAEQLIIEDWINNLHPNGSINFNPISSNPLVGETAGNINLNVTRGPATAGDVTVDFATANGSAEADLDYVLNTSTIAFADGQTSATIVIDIIDDDEVEGNENFFVNLSNVSGGALLGVSTSSNITISDNDDPPSAGILLMNGTSMTVNENIGTANAIIRRAQGTEGDVSVTLSSNNGTAVAGIDFEPISITLNFATTENMQTIPLIILDNDIYQGNKSFSLQLSNAEGGAIIGSPSTTTVTIADNEPNPNAGGGGGDTGGGTEPPPAEIPEEEFRDEAESIGTVYWLIVLLPFYRIFRRRMKRSLDS